MSTEIEVKVPSVGESVTEAAIGRWLVNDGDYVEKDQPVLELDSDKASMEVTADSSGVLKHSAKEGDTVSIGAVVARISPNGKAKTAATSSPKKKEDKSAAATKSNDSSSQQASTKSSVDKNKIKDFSPSKRRAIRHGKLELLDSGATTPKASALSSQETRTPMSSLRKTIAQRLLHSQQSTATLTTFNEVDMTQLLEVRTKLKDSFQKKFEIKLGFMSFFSAAIASALEHYPIVNAQMDKDEIVQPQHLNLGVAVSTDKGLVVPVVRNADLMNYAELESAIATLAEKARSGKLSISEMQGGSFTITNGGVFGSLLSTPILNPPQSGILGMHKTEHRPVAIQKKNGEWAVEVRPMMYLALSYDHRIIDGATSVGFLVKVKEYIEAVTEDQVMS